MTDLDSLMELHRQMATVIQKQDETNRRLDRIESDLGNKYVRDEEHDDGIRRIAALEDVLKWITRTVIGFIILTILGTLIAVKKGVL